MIDSFLIKPTSAEKGDHAVTHIALVLNFNPKMVRDHEDTDRLARIKTQVEEAVLEMGVHRDHLSILNRLHALLESLNYHTLRSSLALFISPSHQKIYYLNFPVFDHCWINQESSLVQILLQRREYARFLIWVLSARSSLVYLGHCVDTHLIQAIRGNAKSRSTGLEIGTEGLRVRPDFSKEEMGPLPLEDSLEDSVAQILLSDPIPVFLFGPEKWKKELEILRQQLPFIDRCMLGDFQSLEPWELRRVLKEEGVEWSAVRSRHLAEMARIAAKEGRVIAGFPQVHHCLKHREGKMLLIRKSTIQMNGSSREDSLMEGGMNAGGKLPFYIKQEADILLDLAFNSEILMEFVEDSIIQEFGNWVLIR